MENFVSSSDIKCYTRQIGTSEVIREINSLRSIKLTPKTGNNRILHKTFNSYETVEGR